MPVNPIKCLFPFISSDGRIEKPGVFGTGVLLRIDTHYFLISAAHVFDQAGDDLFFTQSVAPDEKKCVVYRTDAPGGVRKNDKIDLGFCKLTPTIARQLVDAGHSFLGVDALEMDAVAPIAGKYSFTGYPGSKTKTLVREKILRPKPYEYSLLAMPDAALRSANWTPEIHLGGLFERSKMAYPAGEQITAPEPLGMSGGGVWIKQSPQDDYRLVGIGIEWDGRNSMLIGVRIGLLVPMIKNRFPETIPYLRDSRHLAMTLD